MTTERISIEIQNAINALATCDADVDSLWADSPALAARRAFVIVQCEWDRQAQAGLYGGRVPSYESLAAITFDDTTVVSVATAAAQA